MYRLQVFLKPGRNRMWPAIHWRIRPKPELDGVMAATLLYTLMKCMKLYINCSVLMSVIWFASLLLVWMSVSAYKWLGANRILRHSRCNVVILTGLLPVLCTVNQ